MILIVWYLLSFRWPGPGHCRYHFRNLRKPPHSGCCLRHPFIQQDNLFLWYVLITSSYPLTAFQEMRNNDEVGIVAFLFGDQLFESRKSLL